MVFTPQDIQTLLYMLGVCGALMTLYCMYKINIGAKKYLITIINIGLFAMVSALVVAICRPLIQDPSLFTASIILPLLTCTTTFCFAYVAYKMYRNAQAQRKMKRDPFVLFADTDPHSTYDEKIKIIGGIVMGLGLIVLYGWITGSALLTRVLAWYPSMKPVTTVLFILLCVACLLLPYKNKRSALSNLVLGIIGISNITVGAIFSLADLTHNSLSVPVVQKIVYALEGISTTPGVPGYGALIVFILLGSALIVESLTLNKGSRIMLRIARISTCIGCIALIGYILDKPTLYYYITSVSAGMAIGTAVATILVSYAFTIQAKHTLQKEAHS